MDEKDIDVVHDEMRKELRKSLGCRSLNSFLRE